MSSKIAGIWLVLLIATQGIGQDSRRRSDSKTSSRPDAPRVAIVLRDVDDPAYPLIAKCIERELDAQGPITIRILEPADASAAALRAFAPRVTIAVGRDSALSLKKLLPPGSEAFYCGVYVPEPSLRDTPAVLLEVDPHYKIGLIQEAFPQVHSLGAIYDPQRTQFLVDTYRAACSARGIRLLAVPCTNPQEAPRLIADLLKHEPCPAWLLLPDQRSRDPGELAIIRRLTFLRRILVVGDRVRQVDEKLVALALQPHLEGHAKQTAMLVRDLLQRPLEVPERWFFTSPDATIGRLNTELLRSWGMLPDPVPKVFKEEERARRKSSSGEVSTGQRAEPSPDSAPIETNRRRDS